MELRDRFGTRATAQTALVLGEPGGRYNITPIQPVYAVRVTAEGVQELTTLRWSVSPIWPQDPGSPDAAKGKG